MFILFIAVEIVKTKYRDTYGLISAIFYSTGYILIGFIFYLNPNWRSFQLYTGLFHAFFLTGVL